jgi:hypothetical protein
VIEESPPGGFPPETEPPAPDDYGPEPPQEDLDPEQTGPVDDEWAEDTQVDPPRDEQSFAAPEPVLKVRRLGLPPDPDQIKAAELLTRYKSAEEFRAAVLQALQDPSVLQLPSQMPTDWPFAERALLDHPGAVHGEVARLLPIAMEGMRDPELFADVMTEAWQELKDQYDSGIAGDRDINDALAELAERDGHPLKFAPFDEGIAGDAEFYETYVTAKAHIVDLGALKSGSVDHGVMPHLIQDLVINKAFQRAGINTTSVEFRQLLAQCEGVVTKGEYPLASRLIFAEADTVKVGDFIWRLSYDLIESPHLNMPEVFRPLLGRFGVR